MIGLCNCLDAMSKSYTSFYSHYSSVCFMCDSDTLFKATVYTNVPFYR